MGDIADDIFDEIEMDKLFGETCPLHNIRYRSDRGACPACEDGDPPYDINTE